MHTVVCCWETPRGRCEVVQKQVSLSYENKVIEPVGNENSLEVSTAPDILGGVYTGEKMAICGAPFSLSVAHQEKCGVCHSYLATKIYFCGAPHHHAPQKHICGAPPLRCATKFYF